MEFGNFAFNAACGQTQNLVLELPPEECELCKGDAAGATLCGSCADMIRRPIAIHPWKFNLYQGYPQVTNQDV
jgi:hypothetical protein